MSWGLDEDDDVEEESTDTSTDGGTTQTESSDSEGWGADVESVDDQDNVAPDDGDDEDEEPEVNETEEETFPERFARLVKEGNVSEVTVSTLEDEYKNLDDAEVLELAREQDTRSSADEVYERRLRQVRPDEDDSEPTGDTETSTDETSDGSSWGVDDDTDEDDNPDEADEVEELDDVGVDNLADNDEGDTSEVTEEPDTTASLSSDDGDDGIEELDLGTVAPGAMTTKEASDQPYLWRILGWALPGSGKTHFGFTMPQPVCIIDTEGKAHQLASKFEDKVTYIWQPDNYDEARDAMFEAIDVLDRYLEKGHRGTIVVDSMSEMWEWSKQKYVSKVYDGKSLEEVNLSSNMGRSGESDWKVIKRYHNKRFREVMVDTPYHLYWTAMQTDDYEAIMEGDEGNPKKPVGERDNPYKVDQILRFTEGSDGRPQGQLQKSGSITKFSYTGLTYPTFPKHKALCQRMRELEENGEDPMLADLDWDVRVVDGSPGRWSNDD
ncbi:hypothetical protein DNAM5_98 [Haloarcula californiae tailed virus 1]|uniref:Uncharacterized protein n=1 Tax=Haloarcula californiae tailed virus 1 TaxID=1273746 RepID=R4TMK3_9CAUD|nr:hypothetical protein M202_gp121 [Haloarcula californiae tailed virus 1]AGM11957.1 hypothetical protein DNAM5_98 [Haloarcula californiae tailed virus 1]